MFNFFYRFLQLILKTHIHKASYKMEESLDVVVMGNTYNVYQRSWEIMQFRRTPEAVTHRLINDWREIGECQRGLSLAAEYNDRENLEFYYNKTRDIYQKIFKVKREAKHANPENQ